MKLIVCMPLYKQMDVSCVISLVDFYQDLHKDGHEIKFVFTNGFNAAKARKQLAQFASENRDEGYDYVLWLDSDHVYRKESFYALIDRIEKENVPMVSATYKLHGCSETAHGITENDVFRHFKEEELKEDLIDCTVVGFGFLVMTKKFMEEMWDNYGDSLFSMDARENCTEDVKFCRCVLDSGHRVVFDPKVKVGHIELAVRY